MKLTPPKKIVWFISLLLAIIGTAIYLFGHHMNIPVVRMVQPYAYWIMGAAWLLLMMGVKTKNL